MKMRRIIQIIRVYCQSSKTSGRQVYILSIFLLIYGSASAQLNPNLPPSSNFDLSAWKLQTLSANLAFTEVKSDQLQAGHTSSFFFTDSTDGSMIFKVPSNGGTTSGASHPRVELRQITGGANWKLADTSEHYLTAKCKVVLVATAMPQIIIGQIHGTENESALLKLQWKGYQAGQCSIEARFKNNDSARTEYGVTLSSGLSLGDLITYTLTMKNGKITADVNNISASQTYNSNYYGTSDTYYFKAGNYFGYNGSFPDIYGIVQFYSLSLKPLVVSVNNESFLESVSRDKAFQLDQNFPNPFNPSTVISYHLPIAGNVSLKVFDILGREVATLVNEFQNAGFYNYQFSTRDLLAGRHSAQFSSGVYFYRLKTDKFAEMKKMVLTK